MGHLCNQFLSIPSGIVLDSGFHALAQGQMAAQAQETDLLLFDVEYLHGMINVVLSNLPSIVNGALRIFVWFLVYQFCITFIKYCANR